MKFPRQSCVKPRQQHGVALFTALVFLIIITLLSLAAMRTSTLELKMATNEQEFMRAVASAQSAIDTLLTLDTFPVNGEGYVTCYNYFGSEPCDANTTLSTMYAAVDPLTGPASDPDSAGTNSVRLIEGDLSSFSCRSCETSGIFFEGVTYRIESTYDNTTAGGARASISQGFMRLIASGS